MAVSRRTFIKVTVAGSAAGAFWFETADTFQDPECTLPNAGTPTRFIPNEPRIVERVPARRLAANAAALAIYRAATKDLQDRAATDVISWKKQVAMHCIQCTPTSPTNIHFNWQFLPWHRALLYFHERILRTTAPGRDDIRLPYWDWEEPVSRMLPDIYAQSGQPLHWPNRITSGPNWPLNDNLVNVQPLLAIPTFPAFGGTAQRSNPTPATFTGPHADVHNAFGRTDMGNVMFSPRDPVFYAHHCNLDRLWTSWVRAGHANSDFGDARVFFYDEQRNWRFILQNDLVDEARLGYRYATLMQPTVPTNALLTVRTNPSWTMSGAETNTMMEQRGRQAFLLLENIRNFEQLPADVLQFAVFDGPVQAGASTDRPEFIGRFSRVVSPEHAHAEPLTAVFDVTRSIERVATRRGEGQLRLVPLDADNRATGAGIPLVVDRVTIIR